MCINSVYLFHETCKFQKHHAVYDKYIQILSNKSLKQKLFYTNLSVQSFFILKQLTGVIFPCLYYWGPTLFSFSGWYVQDSETLDIKGSRVCPD